MSRKYTLGTILGLVLVALGLVGIVAQEAASTEAVSEQVTISGQLAESATGDYVLVDTESGDSIVLQGMESDLADHVGTMVEVTGTWSVDDEGDPCLEVVAVETARADAIG